VKEVFLRKMTNLIRTTSDKNYKILVSLKSGYFKALYHFNKGNLHAVLECILGETNEIRGSAMKTFLRYIADAAPVDLLTVLRTISAVITIIVEKANQKCY
jgi:adenosine/AMP kinase